MSHAITFDTLAFAKKLESSGMEAKQAEGFSEALLDVFDHSKDTVATKQDIAFLEKEVRTAKSELKAEMIMWIVGLLFAQTAIIISVIKFVH